LAIPEQGVKDLAAEKHEIVASGSPTFRMLRGIVLRGVERFVFKPWCPSM
jgi:hypothetical protein